MKTKQDNQDMQSVHLRSPKGWINDPNGFIWYKGKYHLFYQHFPYAPVWGRCHWGHAISEDLVHWKHLDTALFPSKRDDQDGCFSGSAIEKDGHLHLFYTGVRYVTPDPENTNTALNGDMISAQLHISSPDGYTFDNFSGKTTVVAPLEDARIGDKKDTRDPKVWQGKNGLYYMILGTTENQQGKVIIYKSKDLQDWEYGCQASLPDCGWMWECPDYFEVDGQGILIFSPMGIETGSQCVVTRASFDEENEVMTISPDWQYLDYGLDLYAPQSTTDKNGNRVLISWLRMPQAVDNSWIGMYCLPRIVEIRDGKICFCPHDNILKAFSRVITAPEQASEEGFWLHAMLQPGEQVKAAGCTIWYDGNKVYLDRSEAVKNLKPENELQTRFETPELNSSSQPAVKIDLFVADHIIEVYVNEGECVLTNAISVNISRAPLEAHLQRLAELRTA